jgi:hypothetical protein
MECQVECQAVECQVECQVERQAECQAECQAVECQVEEDWQDEENDDLERVFMNNFSAGGFFNYSF